MAHARHIIYIYIYSQPAYLFRYIYVAMKVGHNGLPQKSLKYNYLFFVFNLFYIFFIIIILTTNLMNSHQCLITIMNHEILYEIMR